MILGAWQQWLRTLAGLVLVIAFFDLLLPENNSKKLAKLIIGLVITAALLQPVLNLIDSGWDGTLFTGGIGTAGGFADYQWLSAGSKVQSAGMEPVKSWISSTAASQIEALLISSESIKDAQVAVTLADGGTVALVVVTVWPEPALEQLPLDRQAAIREWAAAVTARYLQIDQSCVIVEFV